MAPSPMIDIEVWQVIICHWSFHQYSKNEIEASSVFGNVQVFYF